MVASDFAVMYKEYLLAEQAWEGREGVEGLKRGKRRELSSQVEPKTIQY